MSKKKNKQKQKQKQKQAIPNQQSQQKWEELEDIFQTMSTGLLTVTTELNSAIKLIQMSEAVQTPEIISTISTLTADISSYVEDMNNIHAMHVGKIGLVKDGDDLANCLTVFNDYVILNDKFRSITMLPMLTVSEFLSDIRLTSEPESFNEQ